MSHMTDDFRPCLLVPNEFTVILKVGFNPELNWTGSTSLAVWQQTRDRTEWMEMFGV